MEPAIVFRAGASRVYAVVTWVVAAVVLGAFAVEGGVAEVLALGALPLLLAVIGWAGFWRPVVLVERDGVRVVNVLSTTWLPWEAITGTRTRWGLELTTHERPVAAWALPARSVLSRWRPGRHDVSVIPPLERLETTAPGSGDPLVAAGLIEEHKAGEGAGPAVRPQRQLDVLPAGLLLVTAGLAIVALLL